MGLRQDNGAGHSDSGAAAAGGALFDEVSSGSAGSSGAHGGNGTSSGTTTGASGTAPASAGAPAAAPAKVEIPQNWKDALPAELREAGFMKNVTSVETLAKNYANAQQMIGADKIPLPGKDATPEQWRGVYEKLGLPKTKEEYKPEFSADMKVDPAFLGKFSERAYEMGVLPNQAKGIAEWFDKVNQEAYVAQNKAFEDSVKAGMDGLQKEWGEAYNQKLAGAKTLMGMVNPEVAKAIRESGHGNNPALIKLLSEIAEKTLKEGDIKGTGAPDGKYSPEEAKAQLKNLQAPNSAYYNAADPGHSEAVKKVRELMSMAYPSKTK